MFKDIIYINNKYIMNDHHIVKEYDDYHKKYKKIYGDKTVLLMQIGSFFEMCSIIEKDYKLGEQNIYKICDEVLNVLVGEKTYKYGDIRKPYLMGGFPLISQEKYLTYLLNHNYTIVLVEQITEPPSPQRKVTRIISPGTNIEYNKKQSNFLLSIYIEKYNYKNKEFFECGLSAIDLSTGKNFIHDINNKIDNNYYIDEISRLINFYNPSELIFHTENYDLSIDYILNNWDINHDCFRINHYTNILCKKPSYQENLFNKYFKNDNMLNIIKYLNLDERPYLRLSYTYMLLYIEEHLETILTNIEKPIEYYEKNHLILTSNSIRQLNIVNNYSYYKGKNESLLAICNICETPMGKRTFKDRLLYPLIDKKKIKERYDIIELYRKDKYYNNVREYLKNIQDLEKSLRLMSLDLLQPYDLLSMYLSYEYVNKLLINIKKSEIYNYYKNDYSNSINEFNNFMNYIKNIFNFNNITNNSISKHENTIFNKNNYKDIDIIDENIININTIMENISTIFTKIIDNNSNDFIKLYQKDKDKETRCWILYCTSNRSKLLETKLKNIKKDINIDKYSINPNDINFKVKDNSNKFINIPLMEELSKQKIENLKELSKLNKKYYNENIFNIFNKYSNILKDINKLISEIDFLSSGAKISIDNNYCKPIILDTEECCINVKDIRHPIVEKINVNTEYVTNDIELNNNGILLFGTNACGKSTFMKAMGLNLILAQSGLYVACSEFKYVPYTQIFTRILNNDNIFKSESTFAVEMNELRGIMQRADNKSLVLGDELCSGTETTSALSIVYAGLYTLSKKKSTYIFTSHLHQLSKLNILEEIENLRIYHLQIKYDNNVLIYDRKLKEGPGPSIYGITVCEALGLSKEFVDIAKNIQKKIENKTEIKTSVYNNNIIIDNCKICNNKAEETHHINEQCMANNDGNIKHFHKNINHNLVPLCKKCHLDTTHGKLIIKGYIDTINGIKLNYYYDKIKKNKKKYSENDINIIKKYYINNNSNIKNSIKLLELNENIKISQTTFKKIIENNY